MLSKLFGCVLVLLALFGCGGAKGKADAERAVVEFHQRLDRGEFSSIYAGAHADLRSASSPADFTAFLDAVHRKLGNVKATEQVSWKIGSFNLKTDVMLAYKTTFDSGSGIETFNFRIDGGRATLRGYNINSKELVLNLTPTEEEVDAWLISLPKAVEVTSAAGSVPMTRTELLERMVIFFGTTRLPTNLLSARPTGPYEPCSDRKKDSRTGWIKSVPYDQVHMSMLRIPDLGRGPPRHFRNLSRLLLGR